ncbi:ATP-binding protein [Sphingomonas qomolangmaensis]|uniref:histidine kinase n=1 Tax=Sphingomonas qomolangmaensis TaxID=2918765 RepID=A0ABY5LAY2_9SPHN|nr:ATP-binding protein [Sphingomonas qomolangmaensis]UUL84144.1 ATP-binding protein [Sphingomonas qomolangmaensis]
MLQGSGIRAALALGLAAVSALAGFVIGGSIESVAVALVGGIAAVLVAIGTGEDEAPPRVPEPLAPPPATPEPAIADVIAAIGEPMLVVAEKRVIRANAAAKTLLGEHILGEDVRLAIRHPAASERLVAAAGSRGDEPIHLVGLGTREQRWEMRVRELGDDVRIVHLVDRTGSYATDRIRVDFVANASHELRTPLASILGFIETLRDEAGDDPGIRDRFLKVMFDEANRMRRLIDDLMSLSRIEAEKYREPDTLVDLADLVEEVRSEIAAASNGRGGDLCSAIADVAPIKGDRAQLSQVLHNIVGNAMKYGRPGTPVTIQLRHDGGSMVRLSVTDEGEGIAPQHLPRLTERFYRIDSGRSRAMGGTGLGLSIVKHIVERHRGRLDIASTPGAGTVVTVLLPAGPVSSKRNVNVTEAP